MTVLIVFGILYLPFTQYKLTGILSAEGNLRPTQAIVVLGGGLGSDGSSGVGTLERVKYGIYLYKEGFANYLIFSGGQKVGNSVEAEEMYRVAVDRGVNPEVLIKEDRSSSTYENALYTKKIIVSQDNIEGKVILVTSPYHMRRALLCFRKQGVEVVAAPVKNSEIYRYGLRQSWKNLRSIMHEFAAFAYYWYRGWI